MSEEKKRSRLAGLVSPFWNSGEGELDLHPDDETPLQTAIRIAMPSATGTATPEALAKLRADIGLDEPATAYRVFEGILQTLGDAIPDVALRYKKALQLAERQAVTQDTIVQEFDSFKERIEQQGGVLTAMLDDLTRKKISPKRGEREDVEAALTVKRQEVANLEAELAEIQKIIKAEEDSLAVVQSNFSAAAGAITAELREKERIFIENLNIKK